MLREIKFRAWDGEQMLENSSKFAIDISDGSFYDVVGDDYYDFPVMQYTGLKDKNGKEIYEGDIIRTPDFMYDYDDWIMVFSEEDASFQLQSKENSEYLESPTVYHIPDDLEVIGNIYENSDLLETNNTTKQTRE